MVIQLGMFMLEADGECSIMPLCNSEKNDWSISNCNHHGSNSEKGISCEAYCDGESLVLGACMM